MTSVDSGRGQDQFALVDAGIHTLAVVTLCRGPLGSKVLVGAGGLYGPAYAELVNWVRP